MALPICASDAASTSRQYLTAIDAGDVAGATALLLRDDTDEAPALDTLRDLVEHRQTLGFREAMRGLRLGFAAEYFAHRWSDPTYLSGLALAEAYWPSTGVRVIEPACGTGHFLRAFARHAADVWGGDISFPRLWLARHWIAPTATLACFDATQAWPFDDAAADLVFCHDALHLLADQPRAVAEMRRVAGRGRVLCGHARNVLALGAGHDNALSPQAYAALFGACSLYDDAELTAALIARRTPRARQAEALARSGAVAIAAGGAAIGPAQPVLGKLAMPSRGAALQLNPLYCEEPDGQSFRRFPSQRYAEEIGHLATYPPRVIARGRVTAGADPADDALIRRRVWVDLPPRW